MANIIALSTAQHLHTSYESTVRWGFLDAPTDHALAAEAFKRGAVVAHGFGQFYALSTRPDACTMSPFGVAITRVSKRGMSRPSLAIE